MIKFKFLIGLSIFLLHTNVFSLTEREVLKSAQKHYPEVLVALNQVELDQGQRSIAKSVFDFKLKAKVDTRTEGFYDGDYTKLSLSKKLPFLNSEIYGGVRESSGSFPSYEGKMKTLSDGESFVGAKVSLLRNGLVDKNRLQAFVAEQDLVQSKNKLSLTRLDVQTKTLVAYWNWVLSRHQVDVFKNILKLAEERMQIIKKRVKAGDLARIYQTENQQYIIKRQAQLKKAQFELESASLYLSLFYRDQNGKPLLPKDNQKPDLNQFDFKKETLTTQLKSSVMKRNLDLKILDSQIQQQKASLKFSRYNLLPKLDFAMEWNEDSGAGDPSLIGQETRLFLNFQMPLQNRESRGKLQATRAKLEILNTKKGFQIDKVHRDLQNLVLKLNMSSELIELTKEQVKLANTMVKAEQRKFRSGASDLILLNLREETLAEAEIKNLKMVLDYSVLKAKLYQLKFKLLI